ncbi:hypothetical protein ECFRIK2001_5453, partial [Escherichia coli FRIK2001]
MAELVDALAS